MVITKLCDSGARYVIYQIRSPNEAWHIGGVKHIATPIDIFALLFYWASLFFPLAFFVRKINPRRWRPGVVTVDWIRAFILQFPRMEGRVLTLPFGVALFAVAEKRDPTQK